MEKLQHNFLANGLTDSDCTCDSAELENHTGISISVDLVTTFKVLSQLGSGVSIWDLIDFTVEEGVPDKLVRIYAQVLLDLELAVGTIDNMRAETYSSATITGTP